MCKLGITATMVKLQKPRKLDGKPFVSVDPCIAKLVQALNDAGFKTEASCCGHGNRPGSIPLEGGKELVIMPDYESARKLDKILDKHMGYKPIAWKP